ncbi:putative membrane protein [Caldalkalibacillus uzonensis]|uniref:Membrane protein n=1 Tax=Caldalkalibacillus uzonensis TaxID=353224 RepID=A0ABU0CV53_9BACI|nr:TIGR03943 family protein [Caldalkalibacillus uzonensis]MDQ0339781.1 putative membrane protein [Caldalkalibacillus uzonensis]
MEEERGFQHFLRGIILFGFTMLFLSLIFTGNIQYYIAPRMMPFIYFAVAVLLVLSVVQILRSTVKAGTAAEEECGCEGGHQLPDRRWKKVLFYSIFLFPVLSGFLLPDKVLDSSVAAMRGVQLNDGVNTRTLLEKQSELDGLELAEQAEGNASKTADDYLAELEKRELGEHYTYEDLVGATDIEDFYGQLLQEALEQEVVQITDDNFLDMLSVINMYQDQLLGKNFELMGFVYREEGMKADHLVVARFSMTCCTADSGVYGMLTQGEQAKQYEEDTWIRVTGTLVEKDYNGWLIPALDITEITEVEAPETPYVYPSFQFY